MVNTKRYDSVLAMVKDLADPDFAKEFEKKLRRETVYVYLNAEDLDVQVFTSLGLAKKYAGDVTWEGDSQKGIWESESSFIYRKKITRA